jgi:hypothetical protein
VDKANLRVGVETGAEHADVILARTYDGFYAEHFSAGEFAEEVGLVHAVLEGFVAVDEDDGNFVGELAAQLFVGVHVDVLPTEAATAMEFGEGLFDDFAEVASFAGVDHDLAEFGHWGECSKLGGVVPIAIEEAPKGDGAELSYCARDPSRTFIRSG